MADYHHILQIKDLKRLKIEKHGNKYTANLIGEKILFIQLYVSYFWMYAQREFLKTSCVLLENIESPNDKQEEYNQMQDEYIRAKKKCEELALEVAKGSRDFLKIIGLVQMAFPNAGKLNELIENIKDVEDNLQHFEKELSKQPTGIASKGHINIYYETLYQNEFRILIESRLDPCIDALLDYLKEVIYQESTHES